MVQPFIWWFHVSAQPERNWKDEATKFSVRYCIYIYLEVQYPNSMVSGCLSLCWFRGLESCFPEDHRVQDFYHILSSHPCRTSLLCSVSLDLDDIPDTRRILDYACQARAILKPVPLINVLNYDNSIFKKIHDDLQQTWHQLSRCTSKEYEDLQKQLRFYASFFVTRETVNAFMKIEHQPKPVWKAPNYDEIDKDDQRPVYDKARQMRSPTCLI